jgi:hypothetical protein
MSARSLVVIVGALALVGCSSKSAVVGPTTTIATTTTTAPATSDLMVDGVRPGVLQPKFYPPITVSQVSCGVAPKGGVFVRIDLPAGPAGTPPGTVLTKPTAVIVVPGGAVLVDPTAGTDVLYAESMATITTTAGGGPQAVFVLTLGNFASRGADGLSVVVGNIQINGNYQCPAAVPYPGT